MGCMGLGLEDFCSCTPSEFWKIYESWHERAELTFRAGWEQTRILCASVLQPYSKKRLSAQDIFSLPWDGKDEDEEEKMTAEERKARYEAAKKRFGICD